ncbi:hypothetical protein [Metabacillus indicus]|uniref:hypothetical protein n=1 Tax=Metabacillus indicus TaxID=246786 RepID=UPI0004936C59|nr:hypothetical protein [Metabacillus indicus]KEZ51345.1 hypothetical protein AZ46_0212275 [Metabacillus indicus LMG 22858]
MSVSLQAKFDKVEMVFKGLNATHKVIYIIEQVESSPFLKKFQVKSLKNNQKEISKIGLRIDEILKDPNIDAKYSKEFVQLSDQIKFLSEEFISYGDIIVYLDHDCIKFEVIVTNDQPKEFIFTKEEYWDSLIKFLEEDLNQSILNKITI